MSFQLYLRWLRAARVGGSMSGAPLRAGPLPGVSGHLVKAILVSWETTHWSRIDPAHRPFVFIGECALPGVCSETVVGFFPPGKGRRLESSSRCKFPLIFRRQPSASPRRKSIGIIVGNLNYGVVRQLFYAAVWPTRVTPRGSRNPLPPESPVAKVDWVVGRHKDERPRICRKRLFGSKVVRI